MTSSPPAWACRFVILEVSVKIGRHFWRHPAAPLGAEGSERLPDRFGFDPALHACGPCGEDFERLLAAIGGEAP